MAVNYKCLYICYTDVLFGFLLSEFPSHLALTVNELPQLQHVFPLDNLLVDMAKAVHALVLLLPPTTIEKLEQEELQWVPDRKHFLH